MAGRRGSRGSSIDVGNVISRSFSIWLRQLLPFTIISALVMSPALVVALVMGPDVATFGESGELDQLRNLQRNGISNLLENLLQHMATAAIIYAVFEELRGRRVSLDECLTVGLKRMLSVVVVALLYGLITGIGYLLCIVPGIIIACTYFVTVPVAVVERPGIARSFSRSAALTQGSRGSIFGAVLLFGLLMIIPAGMAGVALVALEAGHVVSTVTIFLLQIAAVSFQAVFNCVVYYDLRRAVDGLEIEDLAKVFD